MPEAEAGPYRDPASGSRGRGPVRALELWSGFPVGAEPRPLVLFEKADRAPAFRKTTAGQEAVWSVEIRGARSPAAVLAVVAADRFTRTVRAIGEGSVRVSLDGRTLTYTFTAGPPGNGPCESDYEPLLRESANAVAVGAYGRPGKARRFSTYACTLEGYQRTVTMQLGRRSAIGRS